ncbi:MAG: hypothetical protein FJ279_16455 [Planctomycetes bacterium]|nr:hypothetical protein [Planctomycetota bacterium]
MKTEMLSPEILRQGNAQCAVTALSPADRACLHTYYDVCPWSPSGRFFALLMLPFEDRLPGPSDAAEVCVLDLKDRTMRAVRPTTAWGFQTAAKQQWGRSDRWLYFNDRRDGQPVGVRCDLEAGSERVLDGPIWHVSPDETWAVSPCLIRANLTQPGYGVSVLPEQQAVNTQTATRDDGFFRVDLATGRCTLWLSLADIWAALPNRADLSDQVLYAFHVKFNPQGTRLLLVVRAKPASGKYQPMLLTCRADGSALRVVLPCSRWHGPPRANHPTWHPDGERILMNVGVDGRSTFVLIHADTGAIEPLVTEPPGVGHPTLTPDARYLLTDVYEDGPACQLGRIRWVDMQRRSWRDLLTMPRPRFGHGTGLDASQRVDLHPVLDRTGRRFAFTAAPDGRRRVFVADPSLPTGTDFAFVPRPRQIE